MRVRLCARAVVLVTILAGCDEVSDRAAGAARGVHEAPVALATLLDAADSLYAAARFDTAAVLWTRALEALSGTDREPEVLTSLGLAAWRRGDYAAASELGERALSIARERGLDTLLPRSYNALGLLAWDEGRLFEAETLYREGLSVARRVGDDRYVPRLGQNLGLVQLDLGRFSEAQHSFTQALSRVRRLGDRPSTARVLINLATLELWRDAPASALAWLDSASRIHREIEDPLGEIEALGQRGVALAAMGEMREGFVALDSARILARERGMRGEEASSLEMIADLYAEAGQDRRALRAYREAAGLYESMGALSEAGDILRSRSRLEAEAGQVDRAQEELLSALDRHTEAGAELERIDDLVALAELAATSGRAHAADTLLARAGRAALDIGVTAMLDRVELARARIENRAGDADGVIRTLNGLTRTPDRMRPADEWEVHALRASAFRRLGAVDSAIAAGSRAVAAVERVRRRIRDGSAADLVPEPHGRGVRRSRSGAPCPGHRR